MSFEAFLLKMGGFGKFQTTRLLIFQLIIFSIPCSYLTSIFSLQPVDYQCKSGTSETGLRENTNSSDLGRQLSAESDLDSCLMYDPDFKPKAMEKDEDNETKPPIIVCEDFEVFHNYEREQTATGEFQIFCGRDHYRQTGNALMFIGKATAMVFGGYIGDFLGRKPSFVIFQTLTVAITALSGLTPNLMLFLVGRFFTGLVVSCAYIYAFALMSEMMKPNYFTWVAFLSEATFGLGMVALSGSAFAIPNWRYLQLAVAVALLIPTVLLIVFVPESLRWLIAKGNFKRAVQVASRMSESNGVSFDSKLENELYNLCHENHDELNEESEKKKVKSEFKVAKSFAIVQIFKNRSLAIQLITLAFCWLVISAVYYGISLGGSMIPGDLYLNTALMGFFEVPAMIVASLLSYKLGRKKVFTGSLIFTGICCSSIAITSAYKTDLGSRILALAGRFGITISFAVVYLYTVEIMPTSVRVTGMTFCSFTARFGAILSPYSVLLSEKIWGPIAFVIFGSIALIAGLLALTLPETHNKPLLDSVEDGKNTKNKRQKNSIAAEKLDKSSLNGMNHETDKANKSESII